MKKFGAEIKGQRVQGAVAKSGTTTWFSLNGEVWTVEATKRAGRKGANATLDASVVSAPMPGKIIKMMISPNAKVAEGDTLIVMEAMKMEYTLKAAAAGVVVSIECSVGQQVVLGETLVQLRLDGTKT